MPLPRDPGVFGVPRAAPTIRCQALGLAQVSVAGRRAHGAQVAAGAVQRDQVGWGPLPGQGTHGAAGCVPVDKGQELSVRAGGADGALGAVGREGSESQRGHDRTCPSPTTLHSLQHPQSCSPAPFPFLNSNRQRVKNAGLDQLPHDWGSQPVEQALTGINGKTPKQMQQQGAHTSRSQSKQMHMSNHVYLVFHVNLALSMVTLLRKLCQPERAPDSHGRVSEDK